jgi:hypothetical protein
MNAIFDMLMPGTSSDCTSRDPIIVVFEICF